MTESGLYRKVVEQEAYNIVGEIRHAATIPIVYMIESPKDIVDDFKNLIKLNKLEDSIGIDYYIEKYTTIILFLYDKSYTYNKESPKDIFHKRWEGELSEKLLYKYYRVLGCSSKKAKFYAKRIMERESSK